MSEKLRTLSLLLKEITKKLICSCQRLEEPFANTQAKLTLNLANNFIRDWSEKRPGIRPCLKICRFCDRVVSETSRQWGTFCCNEAQQFHDIRMEWVLRQSISNATRDEAIDWRAKSKSPTRGERFDDDLRTHVPAEVSHAVGVTDYEDRDARFDERKGTLASADRTTVHRSAREISETRRAEAETFPRKTEVERYDESARETDKFDRVVGRDLTKTAAAVAGAPADGGTRGKIKRSRDIDRTGEYPITPDGREKRDDVPYKSKLDKIRGSRGLRDANDERAAAGKMRKIKRDVKYSNPMEHTEFSKMEPEEVARNRTKERKEINTPSVMTKRSPKGEMTIIERKERKLYRNRLEENEPEKHAETTIDTDIEEKISGRRRKKKLREEEDEEMNEMADINESKVAGRQKRKKKADAFDSGRKVSYRFDEEGKVLKRDGKRKSRSSKERDETESDLTKKHRNVMRGISSAEDKSTLDSESKKERRLDSNGTGDDHSKTNDSRYSKRKMAPGKFNDTQIDDRSPIEYQLSNEHFVRLGWTVLPVAKIMRKIIQYQAKPAKPHLD